MPLYYRQKVKSYLLKGGKWIDHEEYQETQFNPLQEGFTFEKLCGDLNTPGDVAQVIADVQAGVQRQVYGAYNLNRFGDTRGTVSTLDLVYRP